MNNIQSLSQNHIQHLQKNHKFVYEDLQKYFITLHSTKFNHCFKISSPNRDQIHVFYMYFVCILYVFYMYFICILQDVLAGAHTSWFHIRTEWNKRSNGTYHQPQILSQRPACAVQRMICRVTCCEYLNEGCNVTINHPLWHNTPVYSCFICSQICCKQHYSANKTFICSMCANS